VKNFITMDECHHIQIMAQPYMEYSQVTLMDKDEGRPASDFRTSQSTEWCANAILKVKPEKGKVIIFYSLLANGRGDPLSLHGAACPVEAGSNKWAANKWIWNAPMDFTRR
jgi:hypothetical protein